MPAIIIPARLKGRQPEGLTLCEPLKWMRLVRDGLDLRSTVKYVGCAIALHARPDGTNACMSVTTLAWETNTSEATVKRAIADLMDTWLICVTDKGSAHGRQAVPTTYCLSTHNSVGFWTVSREQWLKNRDHQ